MADTIVIRFLESLLEHVDDHVRGILATLPGVTIAAQSEGAVVTNNHRILNFQGPGVVVSDEPFLRRTNVFIPGSAVTGTAQLVDSTDTGSFPTRAKTLWNGSSNDSPPANWQTIAFVEDGTWSTGIQSSSNGADGSLDGRAAAAARPVWKTANPIANTERNLFRQHFTIPAATISSAVLHYQGNNEVIDVYINGTRVAGGIDHGAVDATADYYPTPTQTIDQSLLITGGGDNVIAVLAANSATPSAWVSFDLSLEVGELTADARYQLLSEKDAINGYAGLDADALVPDAELADSGTPSGSTFLRGDRTWAAASTNALTVREVDGTPSVSATVVEFPNGTLADQGGGTVRYTAAATPSYALYQEQQTSGTHGGNFTSGAWRTRLINTEVTDPDGIGTLASNQVTLAAGTYEVRASAPAVFCAAHKLRLQNVTDTTTLVLGSSESNNAANTATRAVLVGVFTVAASKVLELQHQCQTTRNTDGFGTAASFGTEIYAILEFRKTS